jgi:hypothetical protein
MTITPACPSIASPTSLSDIYVNPQDYFLLQFSVDDNKNIHPVSVSNFNVIDVARYPGQPIVAPRSSKYGVRKRLDATHWGILYAPVDVDPQLLHYGIMSELPRPKRIIPFGNDTDYFVITRGYNKYFRLYIARYPAPVKILQTPTTEPTESAS